MTTKSTPTQSRPLRPLTQQEMAAVSGGARPPRPPVSVGGGPRHN